MKATCETRRGKEEASTGASGMDAISLCVPRGTRIEIRKSLSALRLAGEDIDGRQVRDEYISFPDFLEDGCGDRWAAGYVLSVAIDLDPVALGILDVGVGLKLLRGILQRSANQASAQVVGPVALPCIEDLDPHFPDNPMAMNVILVYESERYRGIW